MYLIFKTNSLLNAKSIEYNPKTKTCFNIQFCLMNPKFENIEDLDFEFQKKKFWLTDVSVKNKRK